MREVTEMRALDPKTLTAQQAAQMAHLMNDVHISVGNAVGLGAEYGRALAMRRANKIAFEHPEYTDIVEEMGRVAKPRMAKILEQLRATDDPQEQARIMMSHSNATRWDKFLNYYYSNILSSFKTQERNGIGNLSRLVAGIAAHPFAAGIAKARGLEVAELGEIPSQLAGTLLGFQRGMKNFMFTMKYGFDPDILSHISGSRFDAPSVEMKGGWKNPFNIMPRLLNGVDSLFKSMLREQETYGMAHAIAVKEMRQQGLVGGAADRFLKERMAGLRTNPTREMREAADRFALHGTFREAPPKFAQGLMQWKTQVPALNFLIPFVRTPANILKQGLEFSPAGFIMKGAKGTSRAAVQAQGRAALGSALLLPVVGLALNDQITGSGPTDRNMRNSWIQQGWRPNSIRIFPEQSEHIPEITAWLQKTFVLVVMPAPGCSAASTSSPTR